jgi:hypothetical protein
MAKTAAKSCGHRLNKSRVRDSLERIDMLRKENNLEYDGTSYIGKSL